MRPIRAATLCCSSLLLLQGCRAGPARGNADTSDTLSVFVAASLARPFDALLDTFSLRTGTVVQRESGGSLEHVRKITELHRIPDVLVLADHELFPQLLVPAHASWYAEFARDRMVVAYTDASMYADRIDLTNWTSILSRSDVQVGRSDPDVAPVGYRTLAMMSLAERYYNDPGLASRLLANAPPRNVRGNASELAALLALGELDYVYDYQSLARARGFHWVQLPSEIDLSGASPLIDTVLTPPRMPSRDSVARVITPIIMALTVPLHAPHPDAAREFAAFVLSPTGRSILSAAGVDVLASPRLIGTPPAAIRDSASRASVQLRQ